MALDGTEKNFIGCFHYSRGKKDDRLFFIGNCPTIKSRWKVIVARIIYIVTACWETGKLFQETIKTRFNEITKILRRYNCIPLSSSIRFSFELEDCSLLVVQFIILAQSPQTNRTFHLFVKYYTSAANVRVSSSKIFSKIHDENGTCAVACTSTLRQMGLKVNNVLRKMHFSCSIFIHGQTSTANLSRKLILKVIRVRF